jgi:signal transduction histidine kinase
MSNVLGRLKEIAGAVIYAAEGQELRTVLERIAQYSRELAKARYAALGVPDGKGSLRYFETTGMSSEEMALIDHLPVGHGLIGAIMRERKSIRLEHMQADPRSVGFPENHPQMTSFLGVPILVGDQLYGMLYLTDKEDGADFTEEDQLLIETLAGYAALAIATAEIRQQHNRLQLLEERERIGMELHDGIIQSLYGIGMLVDLMRRNNETIDVDQLEPVVESLNDVIDDIRHYITDLRTRGHRKQNVFDALVEIKDRLHPPAAMNFVIDAPHCDPPFNAARFGSICLIANEAISNAIRHAQASKVQVQAEVLEELFRIVVTDDGAGFDLNNGYDKAGLGLRNMFQRARLHNGKVNIDSTLGEGTTVTIEIPLRPI